MNESCNVDGVGERFVGELTDAALEAVARHGVRGSSVDLEVRLWKALGRAARRHAERAAGQRGELTADLVDAAYRVALSRGFAGSFLELEMDLWHALGRAAGAFCRAGRPAARRPALAALA